MSQPDYFELQDGEFRCWIEQDALICIQAATSAGDPVELASFQVREIASELLRMAEKLDSEAT